MKNPKVLYIIIIIVCAIAIILGIYAQFFAKKDKDVIVPNANQVDENEVKEKTSEEIESQFVSLFNNVLNSENYDDSKIDKYYSDKALVYSAYDIQENKENYEINAHIPAINIKGEVVVGFNTITQNVFANKANQILNSKNNNKVIYQVDYASCINKNILSVIIKATLKEGNNPQRVIIQTYNYNLETGEKVQIADIISQKNLIQSDVQNKINTSIEKAKQEAEVLVQSGYTVYNRDLNNEIYSLANISNYFFGPNENLYIIFAYGNQNYTSEMDIILYE